MGTPFSRRDTANVSLNLCEWPFLISAISKSRRSVRSQTLKALCVLPVPFQKKYSGWISPISFSAESTTGGSKSRVYKQLILHVFGECRRGDLDPLLGGFGRRSRVRSEYQHAHGPGRRGCDDRRRSRALRHCWSSSTTPIEKVPPSLIGSNHLSRGFAAARRQTSNLVLALVHVLM